ncbi:pirin [Spirosoma taeanense]|uniref:Pirin n=1 Tax=Spirosoma taeanense TaxID=2735870 RepID=A0A6M5Y923_9BACT|nr:pirin [Spirosoma taeanense]QJW89994.1 pirin [Spirosoma taeanense]
MDTQTMAQIYLADQRGRSESASVHSRHTFNVGDYAAEGREPFGALLLLNEDTLRAGASLTMAVQEPTEVVLLPIVGGLEYAYAGTFSFAEPGQSVVLSLAAGMAYTVSNPYESEFINYIQFWLTKPQYDFAPVVSQTEFDLARMNTLLPCFGEPSGYQGFIGRYSGRQEGTYTVTAATDRQNRQLFVFVVQGVFEVANRLLHDRDGLALTCDQAEVLEFEALSNDAVLIVIDLATADQ